MKWIDIKKSVFEIGKDTYAIISTIRNIYSEYDGEDSYENMNQEVFVKFDNLFLNFSSYELGEFVSELREAISDLESNLRNLLNSKNL